MAIPLATAKALARALRSAGRNGQTPEAIILTPELCAKLQTGTLCFVRSASKHPSIFDVPVETDGDAEGWALKFR